MRLIQNMTTIAEYPTSEYSVSNRAIKIAVIGGSGVGKTGKRKKKQQTYTFSVFRMFYYDVFNCNE